MANSKEKIDLTSPTARVIEIGLLALAAWKLKRMLDASTVTEGNPPPPLPLDSYDDDSITSIRTEGLGPLSVTTMDDSGHFGFVAEVGVDDKGEPILAVDPVAHETDPNKLAVLLGRISAIHENWRAKVANLFPDSLQKG